MQIASGTSFASDESVTYPIPNLQPNPSSPTPITPTPTIACHSDIVLRSRIMSCTTYTHLSIIPRTVTHLDRVHTIENCQIVLRI